MRPLAGELLVALDEGIAVQEELVELVAAQRAAIVARDHDAVDGGAQSAQTLVMRLGAAERRRQDAAAALADQLGLAATRWSALRAALADDERAAIAPRVERLEQLVRDLELENAINGQLVRQELEVVDTSIRRVGADPRVPAGYTQTGARAATPAAVPMLLNTSA